MEAGSTATAQRPAGGKSMLLVGAVHLAYVPSLDNLYSFGAVPGSRAQPSRGQPAEVRAQCFLRAKS